jgi:protein NrfD
MNIPMETTSTRSNALTDPVLHVWHAEIPLYLFLGGLAAGVMILCGAALLLWRPGQTRSRALALLPWTAPLLLSAGMLFLWLDLENRLNVLRFYAVLRPASPMSWGAWILLLIYPASILLAWRTTPEEVQRALDRAIVRRVPGRGAAWTAERLTRFTRWAVQHERRIALSNVVLGAALGLYTGVLLGTLAARPLWSSPLLGPLFLVSGLSTGAAFMLLCPLRDAERAALARLDVLLILLELGLIGLWITGLLTGGAAARDAAALLLGGPYTTAFWTLVVAAGLLTPLAAGLLELRHRALPGRAAALLVLAGGLALRWIIVAAGQHAGWSTVVLNWW